MSAPRRKSLKWYSAMRDRDHCLLGTVFRLAIIFFAVSLDAPKSENQNLFESKIRRVLSSAFTRST